MRTAVTYAAGAADDPIGARQLVATADTIAHGIRDPGQQAGALDDTGCTYGNRRQR